MGILGIQPSKRTTKLVPAADGWIDGQTDGWMDGWIQTDRRMDGWMYRWMDVVSDVQA